MTFQTPDGAAEINLEGIFLVTLDDGRCGEFREWWNERVSAEEPATAQ
ncbi:MAG: hypothetical protein ICV64_00325 [Thermoleophilia bacterium]|nr:hypothetical protein [Thermoleophilia bacterium]